MILLTLITVTPKKKSHFKGDLMNDKKILFFDIDGTLLTPHPFKVPESTSRALTKAHENGHLLFINTGRTKVMMPSALSELHFDGYIYGCGTHIYMDNKLLFFRTVPNLLCKETVDLLRKCKIEAIFESNTEILYDGVSPAQSEFGVKMRKEIPMVDITKFNREDACTYSYDKFLVHMLPDSDVEKFRSFCNDHYTYFDHGDGIWEVTQKGTSKATGMEFLLDRLSIPKENCYAFGDSPNDLPMLKAAGVSVAMGNAYGGIEKHCTYQTSAVDRDGILHALEHLDLI